MIEWGSLRFIDHAPISVWIASSVVALLVLAVIEQRNWLNFKNRRYFPISLSVLMATWLSIVGFAYYLEVATAHPIDPVVANLQSQLATARRDRDLAVLERDAARREHGENITTAPKPVPPPETIKADDIEARIDVWKSIDGQMNELVRILGEGDRIVANWKSNQGSLTQMVNEFRQHLNILRNRLSQLVDANSEFSDLKAIDRAVPNRLALAIENLLQASSQLPPNTQAADYETTISPYIGPLRRELGPVEQWAQSIRNLAGSSVSELSARQVSK
jgi:hypothetical protein